MFIQSLQFIYEEFMMTEYSIDPLFFIGLEGVFGLFINLIFYIIFYYVECGKNPKWFFKEFCTQDEDGVWRIENITFAIKQIFDNNTILGITYEGNPSDELEIYWGTKKKSGNNFVPIDPTTLTATIKPYCSKQFLFVIPSKNADAENVSGFIKIDD